MGMMIAKQPNGLYCILSTITDRITDHNLGRHRLIDILGFLDTYTLLESDTNDTDFFTLHLWPFDYIKEQMRNDFCTLEDARKILKDMGDENWSTFQFSTRYS